MRWNTENGLKELLPMYLETKRVLVMEVRACRRLIVAESPRLVPRFQVSLQKGEYRVMDWAAGPLGPS
jgi:hypothetical protein